MDRPTILVLDDDAEILDSMRAFLRLTLPNAEVLTTKDPEQALAWVKEQGPALVIADLRLGKHDGLEFLQSARNAGSKALHVLMTGHPGDLAAHANAPSGAVDKVLLKSLETKPFAEWLKSVLRQ